MASASTVLVVSTPASPARRRVVVDASGGFDALIRQLEEKLSMKIASVRPTGGYLEGSAAFRRCGVSIGAPRRRSVSAASVRMRSCSAPQSMFVETETL
jgi:hypothetical protein